VLWIRFFADINAAFTSDSVLLRARRQVLGHLLVNAKTALGDIAAPRNAINEFTNLACLQIEDQDVPAFDQLFAFLWARTASDEWTFSSQTFFEEDESIEFGRYVAFKGGSQDW
jgi:hypothetical protein